MEVFVQSVSLGIYMIQSLNNANVTLQAVNNAWLLTVINVIYVTPDIQKIQLINANAIISFVNNVILLMEVFANYV